MHVVGIDEALFRRYASYEDAQDAYVCAARVPGLLRLLQVV